MLHLNKASNKAHSKTYIRDKVVCFRNSLQIAADKRTEELKTKMFSTFMVCKITQSCDKNVRFYHNFSLIASFFALQILI